MSNHIINIFDLSNEYNYFIDDNLQNNLVELEKHFGNSFYIKFGKMNLIFELSKINHNPYNNIEFYRLIHRVEKRIYAREPLIIDNRFY